MALNLEFIPGAKERYDLIIHAAHENDPKIKALLAEIRTNKKFRSTVESLGGYDLSDRHRDV